MYLVAKNVKSAQACVHEAASIHPLAHTVAYMVKPQSQHLHVASYEMFSLV